MLSETGTYTPAEPPLHVAPTPAKLDISERVLSRTKRYLAELPLVAMAPYSPMISGSSVVLTNPSDIDIYHKLQDVAELRQVLLDAGYIEEAITINARTFSHRFNKKVQLVATDNYQQTLNSFDFSCCQAGIIVSKDSGGLRYEVISTEGYSEYLISGVVKFNPNSQNLLNSLGRFHKYATVFNSATDFSMALLTLIDSMGSRHSLTFKEYKVRLTASSSTGMGPCDSNSYTNEDVALLQSTIITNYHDLTYKAAILNEEQL